jgi:hypothetical protein
LRHADERGQSEENSKKFAHENHRRIEPAAP